MRRATVAIPIPARIRDDRLPAQMIPARRLELEPVELVNLADEARRAWPAEWCDHVLVAVPEGEGHKLANAINREAAA